MTGLAAAGTRVVLPARDVIGSLTVAGLIVSMFVVPWLRAATGSTDPGGDPGLSGIATIVAVVLGGLIYREIVRRESPGTQDTTLTSSSG
jgi:hypothetical protein